MQELQSEEREREYENTPAQEYLCKNKFRLFVQKTMEDKKPFYMVRNGFRNPDEALPAR